MKVLLGCLLLIGACSGQLPWEYEAGASGTSCNCGWYNRNRIVGGRETGKNEFPLTVALHNSRGTQFCGGTIISEWHILTAAHCTTGRMASQISVNIGAHDLRERSEGLLKVSRIIVHPLYDDEYAEDDIAILVLESAITFNKNVGPACLPTRRLNLTGQRVKALGWGYTTNKGISSDVLMQVDLTVISSSQCLRAWRDASVNYRPSSFTNMCTFQRNQDSCNGDSGGPLIYLDPDTNRYTIVALVSYGGVCGGTLPAVNTDVSAYINWINRIVQWSNPSSNTCSKSF